MDPNQAKQQIVERVKAAQNILITVSNNPSVDQLAACIGLTLFVNKLDKHGTAVFSGTVPSTLEFLQPDKTIETNTDSLRDFIISLDKSKADKLRYKVEDQVVRIFITPYRTSLSEKDLVFTQGDFNVDVVMALGVQDRAQLDAAITAHGRILHDATVISVNAGQGNAPDIGQINWKDPAASSLCEMLVSISEAFGTGLIDNQMATSFLTGIVAETGRFRNEKTSPKVMTMAAQLMAAGANQQLIATQLDQPLAVPPAPQAPVQEPASVPPPSPAKKPDTLSISHEAATPDSPEVAFNPNEIHIDEQGNLKTPEEIKEEIENLKKLRQQQAPPPPPPPAPTVPAVLDVPPPMPVPMPPAPVIPPVPQPTPAPMPSLTPALPELPVTAMTEPVVVRPTPMIAPEPLPGPHTLLDPTDHQPALGAPFTANTEPEWVDPYNTVPIDPMSGAGQNGGFLGHAQTINPPQVGPAQTGPPQTLAAMETSAMQTPTPTMPSLPTYQMPPAPTPQDVQSMVGGVLPVPGQQPVAGVDNARNAVQDALNAAPFDPAYSKPVVSLNATPVNVDLHVPPGQTAVGTTGPAPTPSLPLPNGVNGMNPAGPVMPDIAPPAPPPVPPPITPAPGVIIPSAPPQQ